MHKKQENIYRELKKGLPFIYKTDSLGYKFIGKSVFRDCTAEEQHLFDQYYREIQRLLELKFTLDSRDTKKFEAYLDAILQSDGIDYSFLNEAKSSEQLQMCIDNMDVEEITELESQRDLFIKALDYRDHAFY